MFSTSKLPTCRCKKLYAHVPAEKDCHPAVIPKFTLNLRPTLSFIDLWNTKSNQDTRSSYPKPSRLLEHLSIKGMNATDAIYNLPKPVQ